MVQEFSGRFGSNRKREIRLRIFIFFGKLLTGMNFPIWVFKRKFRFFITNDKRIQNPVLWETKRKLKQLALHIRYAHEFPLTYNIL